MRSLSLLLLLLMFLLLLFLLLLLLLFLLLFFGAVCFVFDDDDDDYDNYNGMVTSLHCQGQEYHLGGVKNGYRQNSEQKLLSRFDLKMTKTCAPVKSYS